LLGKKEGTSMSLKTEAEHLESLIWRLLELERDLTIADVKNESDAEENKSRLILYQALSKQIFGSVREDRNG
jgi:hypothetical protein